MVKKTKKSAEKYAAAQDEFVAALLEKQELNAKANQLADDIIINNKAKLLSNNRFAEAKEELFRSSLPSNVLYHSRDLQHVIIPITPEEKLNEGN